MQAVVRAAAAAAAGSGAAGPEVRSAKALLRLYGILRLHSMLRLYTNYSKAGRLWGSRPRGEERPSRWTSTSRLFVARSP
jgi:hypothetical protein